MFYGLPPCLGFGWLRGLDVRECLIRWAQGLDTGIQCEGP